MYKKVVNDQLQFQFEMKENARLAAESDSDSAEEEPLMKPNATSTNDGSVYGSPSKLNNKSSPGKDPNSPLKPAHHHHHSANYLGNPLYNDYLTDLTNTREKLGEKIKKEPKT